MEKQHRLTDDYSDAYLDNFLLYMAGERFLSPLTIEAYRTDLLDFAYYLLKKRSGKVFIWQASKQDLRGYLGFLHEQNRSAATIGRHLSSLRRFFRFLRREQLITEDPTQVLEAPHIIRHLPNYLTLEEIRELFGAVAEPKEDNSLKADYLLQRNLLILELFYNQGLRVSELLKLRDSDFDLYQRILTVKSGKGGKERRLPLSDMTISALERYYRIRHELKLSRRDDILLTNLKGKPLNRMLIYRLVRETARKAELGHLSPHMLRHSFATSLLKGGANLRVIQELLGHADISTTTIYTHVDVERMHAVHKKYHPRG